MFRRNAALNKNEKLSLSSSLAVGEGYWIKTLEESQSVTTDGIPNEPVEFALEGTAEGRFNIPGHPLEFDVCWAAAEVLNPAATTTECAAAPACTIFEANDNGYMSQIAYKWTGSNYASFDGETLGMEGTLVPWDGFWVKAYAPGLSLRIPANAGNCGAPAETLSSAVAFRKGDKTTGPWFMRLIAESGSLKDSHNVLGQLSDSVLGYDSHDLPELSAFSAPYLSIVFPHLDWGEQSGDRTSDYHSLQSKIDDQWYFEVVGSEVGSTVTLRWEGAESLLKKTILLEASTGKKIKVKPGESYTFTMQSESEGFWWLTGRSKPKL